MSIDPIITFKAGICDLDTSVDPIKVKPRLTPGYVYLFREDDLLHFCWRPRSAPLDNPELDLVMVPPDATFTPYAPTSSASQAPTGGRIYVLKFSSSSERHLFWMQSKSQHESGDPNWFSARDRRLGSIVNSLLQGEDVNVEREIASLGRDQGGRGGDGNRESGSPPRDPGDTGMDPPRGNYTYTSSNSWWRRGRGDGYDPTEGDAAEEGEESRKNDADGAKTETAVHDTSSVVQDLLRSLRGNRVENLFTTLADLLPPSSTLPLVDSADEKAVDHLLSFLSPSLLLLTRGHDEVATDGNFSAAQTVMQSLNLVQKKDILRRVLRSPQFAQSLGSLTVALRDGGLPSISEALQIPVDNGGFMRRGEVPLGGGDAVEAFLEGIKRHVEEKKEDRMETD
ncbi:hypothetical protein Egran_02777 [Elaphomyces granulatus]|uniref:Pru domain-containing protein n=1 Tax=Elaphomyces granulatus TaxID=519963 RepID=A0A232LZD2_9EURO|nr:hypothetical protein Egran_02777 [Elaphomyces granulatus]